MKQSNKRNRVINKEVSKIAFNRSQLSLVKKAIKENRYHRAACRYAEINFRTLKKAFEGKPIEPVQHALLLKFAQSTLDFQKALKAA